MNFTCRKWLWTVRSSSYHWYQVQFFIRVYHIHIVIIGIHLHPLRNTVIKGKKKRSEMVMRLITCIKQTNKYEINKQKQHRLWWSLLLWLSSDVQEIFIKPENNHHVSQLKMSIIQYLWSWSNCFKAVKVWIIKMRGFQNNVRSFIFVSFLCCLHGIQDIHWDRLQMMRQTIWKDLNSVIKTRKFN